MANMCCRRLQESGLSAIIPRYAASHTSNLHRAFALVHFFGTTLLQLPAPDMLWWSSAIRTVGNGLRFHVFYVFFLKTVGF